MRHYIDNEMELFTWAPSKGHEPVLSALDLRLPKKKILQKPYISTVDWDAWKIKLQTKAENVLPLIETKNATELL